MMKKIFLSILMVLLMCQSSYATVSSAVSRMDYTGNGNVDTYPYTYKIFANTDLQVTIRDLDNIETTLTLTTDYTVTGVGKNNGGNVSLVDSNQAWLDADGDLLSGYILVIRRVRPLKQLADIRNQGQFFPETHENVFDHLVMIDQQQQDDLNRSIRLPVTATGISTQLPNPTDDAYIGWNADSTGFVNKVPTSLTDSGPIINSGDARKIVNVNNAETEYQLSSLNSIISSITSGSIDFGTDVTVDGTFDVTGTVNIQDDLNVGGNTVFSGPVDFNAAADFTGQTIPNLGTVTTSVLTSTDINGGTIDGVQIGNTVAVTGTFNAVYLAETTTKGTAANEGVLYTKDVSSVTHLFYRPNSNGTEEQISGVSSSQLFTGNGTFTAPSGVTRVIVTLCGGGGGGGGANTLFAGGGGGAAQCIIAHAMVVSPGVGYTVTVGSGGAGGNAADGSAGGNSTFVGTTSPSNYTLTVLGGDFGEFDNDTAAPGGSATASVTTLNATGTTSGNIYIYGGGSGADSAASTGGAGGSSMLGKGGASEAGIVVNGALFPGGIGAGGGGAARYSSTGGVGGAGGSGIVIVQW